LEYAGALSSQFLFFSYQEQFQKKYYTITPLLRTLHQK